MCLCDKITDVSEIVTCSISHNEMFFHTIFWLLGKTSKALSCVFRIEASAEWINVKYSFFKSVAFTFTFACSLSLPSAASLFIFSRHPARLVNQASFLSPWPCLLTGQIHSAWPLSPFNKPSEGWSRRTSESTRQTRKWKRKERERGGGERGGGGWKQSCDPDAESHEPRSVYKLSRREVIGTVTLRQTWWTGQ